MDINSLIAVISAGSADWDKDYATFRHLSKQFIGRQRVWRSSRLIPLC